MPASPSEIANAFADVSKNPLERYEALKNFDGIMPLCKNYYHDPEFWLRLGCVENYVMNGKKKGVDLKFLSHYLSDEALVIRSFALEVIIKLQPQSLNDHLWFVLEDPRNYRNGMALSNVQLAARNVTRSKENIKKAKELVLQFPSLKKLNAFNHLL